jgi:hypothetical protein
LLVSFLKGNGCCFLEGRDTAVANACVCTGDIFDQMVGSNEVADTPASSVEGLSGGADCECSLVELWFDSGNSSKRNIVKAVVDFVREDDEVVLHSEVADAFEFFAREDLADGVVPKPLILFEQEEVYSLRGVQDLGYVSNGLPQS